MKLKEFKEFVNNIDDKYNNLEVLRGISEGAGIKIENYFIYGDCICFIPKISEEWNWIDDRLYKVKTNNEVRSNDNSANIYKR
jgi:hypothetical protein